METFGFDIGAIIVQVAGFAFWGLIIGAFIYLKDKNPYFPRKRWKVDLQDKDGKHIRDCLCWKIKENKVDMVRVQLKGFGSWKGVSMDVSILDTIDENGVIHLREVVPDNFEPSNYIPTNPPLTQKEKFIEEVKEKFGMNEAAVLQLKDLLIKHSRIGDLNNSAWLKLRVAQTRKEEDRAGGGSWVDKYLPSLIILAVCFFAYLILDSAGKYYVQVTSQANAVYENGARQIIASCGGSFHSVAQPANNTTATNNNILPFNIGG